MNIDYDNVMLTSQYVFTPEIYQCIGFSKEEFRATFIKRCKEGAWVVVYQTRDRGDETAGCVIGLGQINDKLGPMLQFTPRAKISTECQEVANKWPYAIGYKRAWKVLPKTLIDVENIAPNTYDRHKTARDIGARGKLLTRSEAENLTKLIFEEVAFQR